MDDRPDVQIRLLGDVEVAVAARTVEIGSVKQRSLLAALALRPGVVVATDHLVELLWRGEPPDTARVILRSLVYRLRRSLAPLELAATGAGYTLGVRPDEVDAHRFESMVGVARRPGTDPGTAAQTLETALALWRGPALDQLDLLETDARRLDELRLTAVEALADLELELGRAERAVARLEAHVAVNPLREGAWGRLMVGLYRLGRQADALERYQQVRRVLADQLGVEPTPSLRELEVAILQHRTELMHPQVAQAPSEFNETHAFLFTDIQASTRRWEGDRDTMAADLERHDDLLGQACRRYGGEIFTHTGDGLCAAFPAAASAIAAAVDGQQLLAAEYGGRHDALRVRMAVHAGVVQRRSGNYFGPTLNRAARLLGVAWGGQVVCSAAAADLAVDHLPDRVTLGDLGEHRLADLVRPERVFQVRHPDLAAEFPPLRGTGGVRHNLPSRLTSFVGREAELVELIAATARSRLVTLVGPGGAGKTSLSLQVASASADRHPDGVRFVDLAPVRDPDLVPHAAAVGAGLDPSALVGSGKPFLAALCDALARRRLLLVLDNCEQVIAAASALAHQVLTECPTVTVLATSREPLAVPGEAVVRIGPLALPSTDANSSAEIASCDAVRLFCDRAREATEGFALTEANAAAVARICRRLDGNPLALELAASRVRLLSAQQLADRLDHRFALLADGPRTVDPRHQTLQAAIDWSHDLLGEPERMVLRRLAVFPADFDLDAAEAVVSGTDAMPAPAVVEVLGLLGRLTDKSLLVATHGELDDRVRYRLLESVREYAALRLAEAGEFDEVRRRHRDFFSAAEEWIVDPLQIRWLRRAEDEADNLRAALLFSAERGEETHVLSLVTQQWVYWWLAGSPDAVEWSERAAALPGPGQVALRMHAHVGLAYALLSRRGAQVAERFAELVTRAAVIADEGGERVMAAWARLALSQRYNSIGNLDAAEALQRQFETEVEGMPAGVRAFGHFETAATALARVDLVRARRELTRAVGHFDPDNSYWNAQALAVLALVEAAAGDGEAGLAHAEDAVRAARRVPGRRVLVMALTRAVETAVLAGRPPSEWTHLDELLATLRELGGPSWAAEGLELAAMALAPTDPESAGVVLGAAVGLRGLLREERGVLAVLSERLAASRREVVVSLGADAAADHERRGAGMHLADALALGRAAVQQSQMRVPV